MKWLLDTNVLSEVTRPQPSPKVEAWLRAGDNGLGVEYLGRADPARYAQALLSTNEVTFWP